MEMSGIIATIATSPNASRSTLPPSAVLAPMTNWSMNVAVIGPEATPPESKAIAVYISGTKKERISAIAYPGIANHSIDIPVMTRSIEMPIASAIAMERLRRIVLPGIVPALTSSTCFSRTMTAGSAEIMNQPRSIAKGMSR